MLACLTICAGCSSAQIRPGVCLEVPPGLAEMTPEPRLGGGTYRDLAIYTSALLEALRACNADKSAIAELQK